MVATIGRGRRTLDVVLFRVNSPFHLPVHSDWRQLVFPITCMKVTGEVATANTFLVLLFEAGSLLLPVLLSHFFPYSVNTDLGPKDTASILASVQSLLC